MSEQFVDLTKFWPKDAAPWTFDQIDLILLLTTSGMSYFVKEVLKHCRTGIPSVTEQLEVLAHLIETCGRAGAKSPRVRISADAKIALQMPKCVTETKFISENPLPSTGRLSSAVSRGRGYARSDAEEVS